MDLYPAAVKVRVSEVEEPSTVPATTTVPAASARTWIELGEESVLEGACPEPEAVTGSRRYGEVRWRV